MGVAGTINKVFVDARGRSVHVKGEVGAAQNVIATTMGLDVSTFSSEIAKVKSGMATGATHQVGAAVGMTPTRRHTESYWA